MATVLSIILANPVQRQRLETRFWSKVNRRGPDDCWKWIACTDDGGYGKMSGNTKQKWFRGTHISWHLHFGEIPEGLYVLHKCDNPPCVNPGHLFLGTLKDNMQDKIRKGRCRCVVGDDHHYRTMPECIRRGSNNPASKLTEELVREILADKRSHREIAQIHGVSPTTIYCVRKGITWRHVLTGCLLTTNS
jgi:hypothetical protein